MFCYPLKMAVILNGVMCSYFQIKNIKSQEYLSSEDTEGGHCGLD